MSVHIKCSIRSDQMGVLSKPDITLKECWWWRWWWWWYLLWKWLNLIWKAPLYSDVELQNQIPPVLLRHQRLLEMNKISAKVTVPLILWNGHDYLILNWKITNRVTDCHRNCNDYISLPDTIFPFFFSCFVLFTPSSTLELIRFGLVWFLCLMAYQPLQVI